MALSGLALVRGLHCCFGSNTHFPQQFEACKFSRIVGGREGEMEHGEMLQVAAF